jgi:hypothetical protein
MVIHNFKNSTRMKLYIQFLTAVLLATVLISCGGDYRQKAQGQMGDVVVAMDSSQWEGATAEAIREVFGANIETIPAPEPEFDLMFRDFSNNEELEEIRNNKNLIFAAPLEANSNVGQFIRALLSDEVEQRVMQGESFAFPLENEWYRDQWSLILSSTDDSTLANNIREAGKNLRDNLLEKELNRWEDEIFERGEQVELEDSLWNSHGWKMKIQHDYILRMDTTYTEDEEDQHFLTMRRFLPENDRWFWAWWKEGVTEDEFLDEKWINAKRDSVMRRFMRGSRDSSYIETEYRRAVESNEMDLNGRRAFETRGTWRMTKDAMGGPFVNLTVYDDATDRLFILEYGQFAPRYDKRRFVRQFQAMLRTFESDSSWNSATNLTASD